MKKNFVGVFMVAVLSVFSFFFVGLNPAKQSNSSSKTTNLDLGQLFYHYGSDKDRNGYTPLYHTLFDHLRERSITLLEIGIGTMIPEAHSSMNGFALKNYKPGGSLRAWRDYFVKGSIIGCDVQLDTQFTDEERIKTCICNSTDSACIEKFIQELGNPKFDIIIDDGSHLDKDQLATLANLYPYLKDNGIYIIEDIYPSSRVSKNPSLLKAFIKNDPYFFFGPLNNVCVIFKSPLVPNSYPELSRSMDRMD